MVALICFKQLAKTVVFGHDFLSVKPKKIYPTIQELIPISSHIPGKVLSYAGGWSLKNPLYSSYAL
jgi:hypothetical protein